MKKVYNITLGAITILVFLMFVGRFLHFSDAVIRTIGICMLVCIPCASFTAVRMKKEQEEKNNQE